jgi:LPPG:FO 2-phospho-L-lactate transferase
MRIVVLAGGVGGSKFLWGLDQDVDPEVVTAIVNTGDDIELHGLRICPDLDIVTYTLAGVVDSEKGWGVAGDTFACLGMLAKYGLPSWFNLGDRDLATHIFRSQALRQGRRLTEVAEHIRRVLGVRTPILPMSDDPVTTYILVSDGVLRPLHFQEYLVQRGARDEIRGVEYRGSARARATAEVLAALREAELVFIAPSNPVASIGPILAVPGIRAALRTCAAPIVAVSPVVGGRSLKGPTDQFLQWANEEVSPLGVARFYRAALGGLRGMMIDGLDKERATEIEALGIAVCVEDLVMGSPDDKRRVASAACRFAEGL